MSALDWIAIDNGQSIFALAWAQAVGCAIMGTALHRKGDIVRVYPPLYTALTTGEYRCDAITTLEC